MNNYFCTSIYFIMKNRVEILSIKKNIIVYKKREKRIFNIVFPLCILSLIVIMVGSYFRRTVINEVVSNMCYIYNPVNTLYSDNGSIVFASVGIVSKESLDFVVPIVTTEAEVENNGNINFMVANSIMVKSIENGVVEEVGVTNDGIKYVVIAHNPDVYSVVENLDILGVEKGDIVKRGQDISTAKVGEYVTVKIFDGGAQVNNLKINQSKIVWVR